MSDVWLSGQELASHSNQHRRCTVGPNRTFFARLKDLPLDRSTLDVAVDRTSDGATQVHLTSHGYSYFAHVLSPPWGALRHQLPRPARRETRTIGVTGLRPGAALRATTYRKG